MSAAGLLRTNRNVWRVERAGRAAVLIDGGAYFGALRESLLRARHCVYIAGWDIDSRMRLVGPTGTADDGFPETLAEFLSALAARRPELTIHLLLWDFSVLYALEREIFPALSLNWKTPDQIRFCLDDHLPLGCSQHQKIVVVDDAVAYCGGLDLTIRRWDIPGHDLENRWRHDPSGNSYRPFHDVQALVDGEAARALGDLVRERWRRARCAEPEIPPAISDCWPDRVAADFTEIDVGIARTEPRGDGPEEIREVERLFFDMIDSAERTIYIENQFMTAEAIAQRLARRMRECPDLEAVLVAPNTPESWIENHTMRNGRIRFRRILEDAGVFDRVRLVYPQLRDGKRAVDIMVHSKVMAIDDRVLRIGSANLNNRSMGADTECDLVFVAGNDRQRAAIARLRNGLLGEHCGANAAEAARNIHETGSITAVADKLSRNGHALRPIEDGEPDAADRAYIETLADPPRPITLRSLIGTAGGWLCSAGSGARAKFVVAGAILLALTLAWQFTPLSELAEATTLQRLISDIAQSSLAPIAVLLVFLAGGLVAFPVTILIAATAASFGPWLGFCYAFVGALASALVTYGIGAVVGREGLSQILGTRLNAIRNKIARQGLIAVVAIRLVPVAPFTLVNLVAGASGIRLWHYLVGTVLGLLPGLVVMSLLGSEIMRLFTAPSPREIFTVAILITVWIVMVFGIQAAMSKYGNAR
ncbi:VTT domain-containing protein [Pseudorhodoplanes sp.]|uniref:VTT domain-containing protein n=1 Tax=Pseudorhodoplanes sp. TaxID=1934341 RepID=UPI003D0BFA61